MWCVLLFPSGVIRSQVRSVGRRPCLAEYAFRHLNAAAFEASTLVAIGHLPEN